MENGLCLLILPGCGSRPRSLIQSKIGNEILWRAWRLFRSWTSMSSVNSSHSLRAYTQCSPTSTDYRGAGCSGLQVWSSGGGRSRDNLRLLTRLQELTHYSDHPPKVGIPMGFDLSILLVQVTVSGLKELETDHCPQPSKYISYFPFPHKHLWHCLLLICARTYRSYFRGL